MNTQKEFLNLIFQDLRGDLIELRFIGDSQNVHTNFFSDVDTLLQNLPRLLETYKHHNVYFGTCPRHVQKGTKDSVKTVLALWVDLDGKDFSGGKNEALVRLREFPLSPSAIIDSGNGYHPYWVLKEPENISNSEDVGRVEKYLKALAFALNGDSKAAEIARILRLPGTRNLKNPSSPLPVEMIEFDPSRKYDLFDFHSFININTSNANNQTGNKPGWIAETLASLSEGNRNGNFAKITGRLRREGWEADDIIGLLEPHAIKSAFALIELRKEVEGICHRYPPKNTSPSSPYNREATETESKPFEAVTLTRLLEGASEEIEWQIEPILSKEAVGILAGPAGYGKSWMLLDLAIEASRGGKWLGNFPTQKGRILYIDEESSPALLKKRLRRLIGAKGVQEKDLDIHFVIGQGLCFSIQGSKERLRDLLTLLRPSIIIIDSLIRVHRAEENSATDMARVFSEVKEIVRDFNCSILFADHQKKPGNFGVSLDLLLRGSTEKAAFVDTLLSLQRKSDALIVEHSKSRFAEAISSFVVRIEDPTADTTTVSYSGEAEELKQKARQEEARKFLDTALEDEWIARKSLVEQAKEAGVSEKALDEALKALEVEGIIEREDRKATEGRGGKAAYYRRKRDLTSTSLFPITEIETE